MFTLIPTRLTSYWGRRPTDGITEALNRHGEMFEDARFEMLLRDNPHLSARDLGEKIISEVTSFTDGARQSDDITLAVIGATI